jgi:hypothetical protein
VTIYREDISMSRRKLARWFIFGLLFALQFAVSPGSARAADCLSSLDTPGCAYGLPADQYQALLPLMQANPGPAVSPLAPDAETIQQYSGTKGHASSFTGVMISNPLPFTMAWVITSTRASELPGRLPSASAPIVPRYTRVYIFATIKARGLKWYLIGPGQWMQQTYLALLNPPARPEGITGRWVGVDLWQQVLTVYEDDHLIFATLISSGRPSHTTRKGIFHIWIRLTTDDMNGGMGGPDEYALPYVPFVMYFDRSISLHGAYWHDNFGYAQSHGCVNMSITDAHWLFNWTEAAPTATVYVWSSR